MTTKQQDSNLKQDSADLFETLKEHPAFQWIVSHKSSLPFAFLAIVVLFFLAFRLLSGQTTQKESYYLLAEKHLSTLNNAITEGTWDEKSGQQLLEFSQLVNQNAELQARYDAPLAQMLILAEQGQAAQDPARRLLNRTKKDAIPFIQQFGETSLLAAQKNGVQALENAKALKMEMINSQRASAFNTLFAYTLLRIAMLEQTFGTKEGERDAWNAWSSYAEGENNGIANAIKAISDAMQEKGFSLDAYKQLRQTAMQK